MVLKVQTLPQRRLFLPQYSAILHMANHSIGSYRCIGEAPKLQILLLIRAPQ